jgi:hypothetical protein
MRHTKAVAVLSLFLPTTLFANEPTDHDGRAAHEDKSCHLRSAQGNIQHVIYIQFDNVHLKRDNPNVPSDLEQMPHLYGFLKGDGTLLEKQYTVLISATSPRCRRLVFR